MYKVYELEALERIEKEIPLNLNVYILHNCLYVPMKYLLKYQYVINKTSFKLNYRFNVLLSEHIQQTSRVSQPLLFRQKNSNDSVGKPGKPGNTAFTK